MTLNGSLAGLVAVTAGCANVDVVGAFFIGLVAGILVDVAVEVIDKKLHVDDPVGAIAVHGVQRPLGHHRRRPLLDGYQPRGRQRSEGPLLRRRVEYAGRSAPRRRLHRRMDHRLHDHPLPDPEAHLRDPRLQGRRDRGSRQARARPRERVCKLRTRAACRRDARSRNARCRRRIRGDGSVRGSSRGSRSSRSYPRRPCKQQE